MMLRRLLRETLLSSRTCMVRGHLGLSCAPHAGEDEECVSLLSACAYARSYIAEMSPDEEDAPLPRGSPIGSDSTGTLYFRLGGDSGEGSIPCPLGNYGHGITPE